MERLAADAVPINLRSDNVAGVAPEILAAIAAANAGSAPSYGADPITARLQDVFSKLFETRCFVQPVATGTATNALALTLIAPPYGAVYCTAVGHVHDSECGAGEFYTGGAKIVPLAEAHGRLRPDALRMALRTAGIGHSGRVQPAALNLTQATERGTVYRPDELDELVAVAREYGLRVHMDGARFANAIAALGCSPADVTWRRGVDVLSFGATKNGAMGAEAVVVFSDELAEPLRFRARRAGQVFSKMRFISAQLEGVRAGRAVAAPRGARQCHGAPPCRWRCRPARRASAASGRDQRNLRRHAADADRRPARGRLWSVRPGRRRGAPGHGLQQHRRADRRLRRGRAPARLSGSRVARARAGRRPERAPLRRPSRPDADFRQRRRTGPS
jgi:threonine aldolase